MKNSTADILLEMINCKRTMPILLLDRKSTKEFEGKNILMETRRLFSSFQEISCDDKFLNL